MSDPTDEITGLLKKLLVVKLSEMNVPQGTIARKLKMNINTVNDFLKGIKKDAKKAADRPRK